LPYMCLQVRVETDPSDRTQMRLTVASQDPNATYEYVSFPYLLVS
jgi:AP-2 complex subunit alpha